MREAVLVVPPLIKYLAGPLGGPSMLAGVATQMGAKLRIVDLNAHELRRHLATRPDHSAEDPRLMMTGDHARPSSGFAAVQEMYRALLGDLLGEPLPGAAPGDDPVFSLCYGHEQIYRAASRLAESEIGRRWKRLLEGPQPHFVGLSVLWSGQVLPALAATLCARELWPEIPVIWGGPHVTAIASTIAKDPAFGYLVDGFIVGRGENAIAELFTLDAPLRCDRILRAGHGLAAPNEEKSDVSRATPTFSNLHLYGEPHLVLPYQLSRGCAYGQCAFCSYPAQDGPYHAYALDMLEPVLKEAVKTGAILSFNDAFLVPKRADEVAQLVDGRVPWAASTRLLPILGRRDTIDRLVSGGLQTLELGVETLDPDFQRLINKQQKRETLYALLDAIDGMNLHVVLNTIYGWPNETLEHARQAQRDLNALVRAHPHAKVSLEQNLLQIQPMAPLYAHA
ncbi:MAG: radical SAM protein, partial [Lentisphaeria bacterium]|nr:radical SAM protein [Lentisphaeria bacterium]